MTDELSRHFPADNAECLPADYLFNGGRMLALENIPNTELYKSLFENSYSIMLIIHPETGRILDANKAACFFYGYEKKDLTEKFIHEINTLSRDQVYNEMRQAKEEKRNYFNFRHRIADGCIRDVEVYTGPITLGREQALYSIIHDITDRMLIEKQIQDEKNFSESLIHSLPGIMYLFDEMGNFKRWNKNLEDITGYSAEEIKTMTPLDFIDKNDKERVGVKISQVLTEGAASVEAFIFSKDGKLIPFYFTGTRLQSDGIKFIVGIGIDITERKQIEDEKENLISRLHETLSKVKQLSGFLPICASCKKIRDDKGYWNQIETYIKEHSEAEFSHSICPDCARKLYPNFKNNCEVKEG